MSKRGKIKQLERRLRKKREQVKLLESMLDRVGDILLDTKDDLYYKRKELDDLRATSYENIEHLRAVISQTSATLDSASYLWTSGGDGSALTSGIMSAMEILLKEID